MEEIKHPGKTTPVNFHKIDKKQQERWEKAGLFKVADIPRKDKKFYCLDFFPYPSGDGLHVGHAEGYAATDIFCRYKRMKGFDVLHPTGWDAFGLPAENYAISTGIHPEITTGKNIGNFERQMRSIGLSYDWSRKINTTDPEYYKWTQWIFLQLYKKGLAYEGVIPINWCPSCKTGLANEEVFGGACERCSTAIERRNLRQWILRITAYGQRLLDDLDGLDWPESTMAMQRNWLGRSEGAEVHFPIAGKNASLTVFTTRPDTLYGASYMVIAPEHPMLAELTAPAEKNAVENYVRQAGSKSDLERVELQKEKTGVFTGSYAVNPLNGEKIPVWTADYVLAGYGTGAIMAVPAHDERDWDFARKFNLPIIPVVKEPEGRPKDKAFCGDGVSINSPVIDGLPTAQAKEKMIRHLEDKKIGRGMINFKLRDWVFSRQRYWGEPIPVIHCSKCGIVPVPENELPVLLPKVEKYEPTGTGESPLAAIESWVNTKCPGCGGAGKRETNTMPQWAGSCWYYLRFIDPKNKQTFCAGESEKAWMPVDLYVGGAEHAVLHLLYARFWHKALYDLGFVSTKEPFQKLRHQGMILSYSYRDSGGAYHPYSDIDFSNESKAVLKATSEELPPLIEKMSKSKKNVVNPDEILAEYGADTFRMYEMFIGPFEDSKPWDMKGIEGVSRFLKRVWFWTLQCIDTNETAENGGKELEVLKNKTIDKVSSDIEAMRFNTAISALMIYFNKLSGFVPAPEKDRETFLTLLHPFAPHITDELWQRMGNDESLFLKPWPEADLKLLRKQEAEIAVQLNGKIKDRIKVPADAPDREVEKLAVSSEKVRKALSGMTIKKIIVVPKRLVSIVAVKTATEAKEATEAGEKRKQK